MTGTDVKVTTRMSENLRQRVIDQVIGRRQEPGGWKYSMNEAVCEALEEWLEAHAAGGSTLATASNGKRQPAAKKSTSKEKGGDALPGRGRQHHVQTLPAPVGFVPGAETSTVLVPDPELGPPGLADEGDPLTEEGYVATSVEPEVLAHVARSESGFGRSATEFLSSQPEVKDHDRITNTVRGEMRTAAAAVSASIIDDLNEIDAIIKDAEVEDPAATAWEARCRQEFGPKILDLAAKKVRGWEKRTWTERYEFLRDQRERERGSAG